MKFPFAQPAWLIRSPASAHVKAPTWRLPIEIAQVLRRRFGLEAITAKNEFVKTNISRAILQQRIALIRKGGREIFVRHHFLPLLCPVLVLGNFIKWS